MKYFKIGTIGPVEAADGAGTVLLSTSPDDHEKAFLQQAFRLDDYDIASTLDADEVPRLEAIDGRLLLIWKIPESASIADTLQLGVGVVGIVLYEDRVAFIRSSGDLSFTEREFRGVRDARDVMLALLLRTVRHFVGHLRVIRQISSELENKITVSMENRHLVQMFSLSESLVYYLDAIEGNAVVLTKLRHSASHYGFDARQIEQLDDIILENSQAARQATIFSSVLSGLMDARGTIVNNNMNVLLKNLTLINIVFLPLNLIASIGGMSEYTMMTQGLDWRVSYLLLCFAMFVLGWGTWVLMKKTVDRLPAASSHRDNGLSR